jgi:hypothetical protein
MGSSQQSIWVGRLRHGRGQWFMGTGFLYMAASAMFRMAHRPFVLGGAAMMLGWLGACLRGAPRYPDLEFRRFLRRYQMECLRFGKRQATARCNERTAAAFRGARSDAAGQRRPDPRRQIRAD